jgi:hypothetical protein
MDPRTFLPPRKVPLSGSPTIGRPAPPLPVAPDGRPSIVAFQRHVGCPIAEATQLRLAELGRSLHGVRLVAVSHADEGATRDWCRAIGTQDAGIEIVADPTRQLYAHWGLGRTTLSHFMGRESFRAVQSLAGEGIRNRHPVGTRWQSAGTFALDAQGCVRWMHVPAYAGDMPDLDAAVAAITGTQP